MTRSRALVVVLGLVVTLGLLGPRLVAQGGPPTNAEIIAAFGKQGMRINGAEAQGIRDNVRLALKEAATSGIGNSKNHRPFHPHPRLVGRWRHWGERSFQRYSTPPRGMRECGCRDS